jgi:aryl-alcohol dehydrogenase
MQITAAVVHEPGGAFQLESVRLDGPRPGEVLVKIAAVGLCHTDVAARQGHLPFPLPGVFGHEGAGTVVAVGEGVTRVSEGDTVVLTFNSCGSCGPCTARASAYCRSFGPLNLGGHRVGDGSSALSLDGRPIGAHFFGQSSFATHAVADERTVVKVGSGIDPVVAAPLGCGVQTGAGTVLNALDCRPGTSLLVLGGGSVGLSAVLAASVRSLGTVIVVDPLRQRRDLALQLGATHALDPADGPLVEQVWGILADGVDHAFDTTGNVGVVEAGLASLAQRGTLGIVGVPSDPKAVLPVSLLGLQRVGASVRGIIEGDSDPETFIPELVALHGQGRLPFDRLITTRPFAEINEAVSAQARGEGVKFVLTLPD